VADVGGPGAVVCRQVVVSGRVQGVFYRRSCQRAADAAGVTGWVANRTDGSVEAMLEGPADAVDEVLRWMGTGPRGAKVTHLEVRDRPPTGARRFEVR
jgi:acylphosphatase